MISTSRDRLTLDEAMGFIGARWTAEPYINFDPGIIPQYRIRRASTHDGTFLFSKELMLKALSPLFSRASYYKPMGEPPAGMVPEYTIGMIKRFSVFGDVVVPAGKIFGERECVVIPVRCKYVQK